MKLNLAVALDVKGASKKKLMEELWEQFREDVESKLDDSYYLEDEDGNEVELEVMVEKLEVAGG